jgi:hypothetical protein
MSGATSTIAPPVEPWLNDMQHQQIRSEPAKEKNQKINLWDVRAQRKPKHYTPDQPTEANARLPDKRGAHKQIC